MRKLPKLNKTELYFAANCYSSYEEMFASARKFLRGHEDIYSEMWGMNLANGEPKLGGILFIVVRMRLKKAFVQNCAIIKDGLKSRGLTHIRDADRAVATVAALFS